MISTLLLSLALGNPAQPVARPIQGQGEDPAIRVWLNEDGRFQRGDQAKAYVRSRDDGYLVVLHVDPDNRLRVLFPLDPADDNFIRGGKKYQILGRGERETFEVDVRTGRGTVYAAVSRDPFRWDGFVAGDHWDFRALNDVPLSRDLEADLNDLVRRLATVDFDYDFVDYEVYERVYASGSSHYGSIYYGPSYYASYDPYYSSSCLGYWGCGGSGLFIGIGIGDPWYYPYHGYYPRRFYPYHYPYSYYNYPAYYYPYRPYRPFYPYRYRDPYRYRGAGSYYAGGYYFGGHYSAPWRNRLNDRFYSTSYAWRGREATTDLARPGRFSTGYRERGFDRGEGRVSGGGLAGATSRRRGVDAPAPHMTPVRTEGRRSTAVVANPSRGPEGRRGEGRRGTERADAAGSRPLPVRVGAGADGNEPRRAEPRRSEEARGPSRERDFVDGGVDDRRRGYESGVIEGRREVDARGPERGPSRARQAVDDRGQTREPRERPQYEPRPAPRPEPRSEARPEPRSERRPEPRAEPRAEPRREAPAPRMDAPRSAPRVEPRPAPRDHGSSRGRPSRKN